MEAISKTVCIAAMSALILSGCSTAQVRGTPAASPEECKADWQTETRAANTGVANTSSFAAAIATIFASTVVSTSAKDAANQRFKTCLARFGIDDVNAYLDGQYVPTDSIDGRSSRTQPRPVATNGFCPEKAGVIYGGASYCVRY